MKELYSATSVEVVMLSALRGITAKLITGGFALRISVFFGTLVLMCLMHTVTLFMEKVMKIPTGGEYPNVKCKNRSPSVYVDDYVACLVGSGGLVDDVSWSVTTSCGFINLHLLH